MLLLDARERALLGALVGALVAGAILGLANVSGLIAVQRDVGRSEAALAELARVDATLKSAEAAQRTYLLNGGRTSLAALEAAGTVLGIRLDRIGEMVHGDPDQAARLATLGMRARRHLAALEDEARRHAAERRAGAERGTAAPDVPPVTLSVRGAMDAVEDAERRTLAERQSRASRRSLTAMLSGIASTLLGLCLVAAAFLLLGRQRRAHTEVAAALEKANAALRDEDRRKDEFLVTLAHELRNPLGAMRGALELLAATEGGADGPAERRGGLARAILVRQLRHLTRLVDDLLDLSRVTSRRVVLHREAVPLSEAIESALETTRPALEARGHRLSVRLPAESVVVEGDAVRLAQILANLLTNAAKYSTPGGRIEIAVAADEAEAVVRVTDDGIGLRPEDLERVFGLFEQAAVRSESEEGLGVGLALSRRLAQLHGGSLVASSPGPGLGSTFTLRLPRATAPSRPAAAADAAPHAVAPRRVLLVEDNADAASALAELLSLEGHDVHLATDGLAGLEAARRLLPDAVVLDLGLPGIDGYELARRLRAEPALSGVLLIALSGWAGREERSLSAAAGIDHHLVKPAPAGRIAELLGEATSRPRT